MRKKLLIIIKIVIILIIVLLLYLFRFEKYTLKVDKVTDTEIYAKLVDEEDLYYFLNKSNAISFGVSISDIKEGDTIRVWQINYYRATTDGLATFYEEHPCIEIEGIKIITVQ